MEVQGDLNIKGTLSQAGEPVAITFASSESGGFSKVSDTIKYDADFFYLSIGGDGNPILSAFVQRVFNVRDERSNGTNGGTFTAGSYVRRTLNTIATNTISGASLAGSQFTLPAGTYNLMARAPARLVNNHRLKIRNITDDEDAILGSNTHAGGDPGGIHTDSWVIGQITITGTKVFELQHRCITTRTTTGRGDAQNFGENEVYAEVWITQVSN